ncbi:MAG: TRAP transporter small permease subunit [Dethiobacteria bacterium]|jgi:TRAP-type C4-dicarboxylate transport system permease small subunit|nr:TRAP transporter small permease [Bacillota bacterium]
MGNKDSKGLINNIFTKILQFFNSVASVWIFVLMFVIVWDVGGRLFFKRPLLGTAEIVSLSIVSLAFLQIPYTLMINRHVSSTIFFNKFPKKIKMVVRTAGNIVGAITFILLAVSAWEFFVKAYITKHTEGTLLLIPSAPIRFIIVLGSALMAAEYIRKVYTAIKYKEID